MTKPVVSVAMMTLVDKGLLRLEAPVSDFIPEFADCQALIPGASSLDQTEPCPTPTLHQIGAMSIRFPSGPAQRPATLAG